MKKMIIFCIVQENGENRNSSYFFNDDFKVPSNNQSEPRVYGTRKIVNKTTIPRSILHEILRSTATSKQI